MKKYVTLIAYNIIIIILCYTVSVYPIYSWFMKAFWYVLLIGTIFGNIVMVIDNIIINKMDERKETLYMILDLVFDLIFLFIFIILNYKAIFVLYMITTFFSIYWYIEVRKEPGETK